jgi:sigma-B regulation protein RsbQ
MKEDYAKWASYFAPKAMGNADRPVLAEHVEDVLCEADPYITYEFAKVVFLSDNRKDLSEVKIPTHILQLSEDIIAPTAVGEFILKNIPGSTIYYMNATGHFPHLSAVDETINVIKNYLQPGSAGKNLSVTNSYSQT